MKHQSIVIIYIGIGLLNLIAGILLSMKGFTIPSYIFFMMSGLGFITGYLYHNKTNNIK
jgi:hypothetical protein